MPCVILVPGFQRRADRSACNFTQNHQAQLGLLENTFYLKDLHYGNYGLDGKLELAVVDFGVISNFYKFFFLSTKRKVGMFLGIELNLFIYVQFSGVKSPRLHSSICNIQSIFER